jgi:hypothetical protein
VETAPLGDIHRVGDLAGQHHALAPVARVGYRDHGQQSAGVGLKRCKYTYLAFIYR